MKFLEFVFSNQGFRTVMEKNVGNYVRQRQPSRLQRESHSTDMKDIDENERKFIDIFCRKFILNSGLISSLMFSFSLKGKDPPLRVRVSWNGPTIRLLRFPRIGNFIWRPSPGWTKNYTDYISETDVRKSLDPFDDDRTLKDGYFVLIHEGGEFDLYILSIHTLDDGRRSSLRLKKWKMYWKLFVRIHDYRLYFSRLNFLNSSSLESLSAEALIPFLSVIEPVRWDSIRADSNNISLSSKDQDESKSESVHMESSFDPMPACSLLRGSKV